MRALYHPLCVIHSRHGTLVPESGWNGVDVVLLIAVTHAVPCADSEHTNREILGLHNPCSRAESCRGRGGFEASSIDQKRLICCS